MAFLEEYTLLDELGQGGYATVYKVRHNELGYIRALRVMNAVIARGAEDKTYRRFIEECRLLMRLGNGNHPHIVRISKTLLKEQRAAVEMDFIDGCSLMKHIGKCSGFVPVEDVMKLLEQMSSALAYCHHDIYRFCMDRVEDELHDDPEDGSKVLLNKQTKARLIQKYRVIHNDIHSDNIIRREDGSYVLLDFGLAIQGESVVRSSRREDGAPEFKAPEKWDGDTTLTTQSDIYSFGVVLYECLTGRVPFPLDPKEAGSAKAIYLLGEAHKSHVPDSIFELRKVAFEKANPGEKYDNPDYPQWLEDVILKCLEKDPAERFADGKDLYDYVVAMKQEEAKRQETIAEPDPVVIEVPVTTDVPKQSKTPLYIAVAAAVVACLLAVCGGYMAMSFKAENDSLKVSLEEALKPVLPLDETHPAIVYLENTSPLNRTEMEAMPELRGLWDAINTYDYLKIASYFDLLQHSDEYISLLMKVRVLKSHVDSRYESGKVYTADGEEISINKYLFKLLL